MHIICEKTRNGTANAKVERYSPARVIIVSLSVKMLAKALGKTNSAAVYIIPKLIATVIAKPVERRMLTRSPAPQY